MAGLRLQALFTSSNPRFREARHARSRRPGRWRHQAGARRPHRMPGRFPAPAAGRRSWRSTCRSRSGSDSRRRLRWRRMSSAAPLSILAAFSASALPASPLPLAFCRFSSRKIFDWNHPVGRTRLPTPVVMNRMRNITRKPVKSLIPTKYRTPIVAAPRDEIPECHDHAADLVGEQTSERAATASSPVVRGTRMRS